MLKEVLYNEMQPQNVPLCEAHHSHGPHAYTGAGQAHLGVHYLHEPPRDVVGDGVSADGVLRVDGALLHVCRHRVDRSDGCVPRVGCRKATSTFSDVQYCTWHLEFQNPFGTILLLSIHSTRSVLLSGSF